MVNLPVLRRTHPYVGSVDVLTAVCGKVKTVPWLPSTDLGIEVSSDFASKFFGGNSHPNISGCQWYRVYWIPTLESSGFFWRLFGRNKWGVLLGISWVQDKNCPPPLVLVVGNPSGDWIVGVLRSFALKALATETIRRCGKEDTLLKDPDVVTLLSALGVSVEGFRQIWCRVLAGAF